MRCFGDGIELYERYHDTEWGRPQRSEEALYEKICLEGLQSGLSWITILRKRAALREAFSGFDPEVVAGMDIAPLLKDARLIRSRMKLQACVTNARATLAMEGELSELIWSYRSDGPAPKAWSDVPPLTEGSTELAKVLKRKGFVFVGPTTVYSLMQALGIVNDHLHDCAVRADVEAQRVSAHEGQRVSAHEGQRVSAHEGQR